VSNRRLTCDVELKALRTKAIGVVTQTALWPRFQSVRHTDAIAVQTLAINAASAELVVGLAEPSCCAQQSFFQWRQNAIALWANVPPPGVVSSRAIVASPLIRNACGPVASGGFGNCRERSAP
jgi:hypothetical protein